METFSIKRGDTAPALGAILKDGDTAVDLTGKTVEFVLRQLICVDGVLKDGPVVISGPAVVVDAPTGDVRYDWSAGDTDVEGQYRAEFKVFSGGRHTTYPDVGYIPVIFQHDLE